jgi:hypothetical protein
MKVEVSHGQLLEIVHSLRPDSMTYTQGALWRYLYGRRFDWEFADDKLMIKPTIEPPSGPRSGRYTAGMCLC